MYERLVDPFNLSTASTANSEKCCLSWVSNFELRVVFAMLIKSSLNFSWLEELSLAIYISLFLAASRAILHPLIMV
jgi:hypothetical protein